MEFFFFSLKKAQAETSGRFFGLLSLFSMESTTDCNLRAITFFFPIQFSTSTVDLQLQRPVGGPTWMMLCTLWQPMPARFDHFSSRCKDWFFKLSSFFFFLCVPSLFITFALFLDFQRGPVVLVRSSSSNEGPRWLRWRSVESLLLFGFCSAT